MSEKEIENESLDWLNRQPGVFAVKIDNSAPYSEKIGARIKKNKFSPKGFPDCIVMLQGAKVYYIEFKDDDGVQSKDQIAFEKKVVAMEFSYYVCRDLVDTKNSLERELG